VGREGDVERVLEALSCRTWNRMLLVSESAPTILGVVETVACRIVNNRVLGVPRPRLIAVHPCSFLGRGPSRARTRVLEVLAEARRASEVILFLDDLHLLAQCEPEAGLAGAVQASLLIGYRRPLLAAATPDGYRHFLEPNRGLASLLDTLVLQPPSREQTAETLRRLRHRFETHHHVRIPDAALTAAIEAAARMPATRPSADWATLLLDRACARLRLHAFCHRVRWRWRRSRSCCGGRSGRWRSRTSSWLPDSASRRRN
jgi:ATP-dependent Clp protease ATP-binding subunit ClpA